MKPIREIVIREYLPGEFEVECDGRVVSAHSHAQMGAAVVNFTGKTISWQGHVAGYNSGGERPWGDEGD